MVRINRVYTKTGDKGKTRLAGGQPIEKSAQRLEAYGTVDELNAQMGLVAEALRNTPPLNTLHQQILQIQNELFDLGAQMAVLPKDRRKETPIIQEADVTRLEKEIDEMNEILPSLTSFILPGGGEIAARLHVARVLCRRTERETIRLAATDSLDGTEIPYLNRLGDWLFVAARFAAQQLGVEETLWVPGRRTPPQG